MKRLIFISLLISSQLNAETVAIEDVSPESVKFCQIWTGDAKQAAEKRMKGIDDIRLNKLVDQVPIDMMSEERKLMAKSAIAWSYYFRLTPDQAVAFGYGRCIACVEQPNQQACVANFDDTMLDVLIDEAEEKF